MVKLLAIDLTSLAFGIGGFAIAAFVGVILARNAVRAALKTELKTNAVEKIFETMGFKHFKMSDLKADKLDDKGFERFRIMLYDIGKIYGQAGPASGKSVISQIQELTQLGQALGGARQMQNQQQQQQETPQNSAGSPA